MPDSVLATIQTLVMLEGSQISELVYASLNLFLFKSIEETNPFALDSTAVMSQHHLSSS